MSIFCRILLPSLIVGLLASMWIHLRPFDSPQTYYFNVHLTSDRDGRARVYWDTGHGFAEYASIGSPIHAGTDTYRFPLPPARLQTLRLWPLDRAGKVTIHRAAVTSSRGETLHVFPTSRLVRTPEETGAAADENGITLQTKPGEGLDFKPGEPLVLAPKWSIPLQQAGVDCAIIAASIALLLLLIELFGPLRRFLAKPAIALRSGFEAVPVLTLCITAVAAAVLSCYPVVFAGKSFVSPGNGALLLYDDVPTVPRAPVELPEDSAGSDVGALMWAHLPYSAIQHRAIFQHGELPLWNRYNYCGTPLLAQGLTMIGDPLHWLTIASGGANWAWDVKFLCAKALFALGVGLCVRAATGGLWVAVLCAISSAFLGFFSYRFSHPAFFALCYAPWILLPWLRVAITTGRIWPWVIGLALANFWQLNSGVVKESLALILGLNFTGGLLVLLGPGSGGARLRRLLAMSWGLVLFALLSAPCWLVFFDALRSAWTPYSAAKVFQIQPSLFIGLFDDLFYRQLVPWENHFNPAANFLILLGCIWAVVNIRSLLRNSAFLAVLLGSVPPALLVFGIIPPSLIADVPFLGQVQHIDNTFSVVLIIHLLVLAAFGLRSLWQNTARLSVDSLLAATIFAVLLGLYFGYAQASHREGHSLWAAGTSARFTIFFLGYSIALMLAVLALPWAVWSLRRVPNFGALLIAALALIAMHFRHGMWTDTPFDRYVMNPRMRGDLTAASASVAKIHAKLAAQGEPARVAGFKNVMVPGYQGLLGLEHFSGADALVNPYQRQLAEATGATPQWGWRWRLGLDGNEERTRRLRDLWGVRYLLAMPCDVGGDSSAEVDDLAVTENPKAWPRAFFADRLIKTNALSSFVALLDRSSEKPFAAVTDGVSAEAESNVDHVNTVPASKYELTTNTTKFQIAAPGPGVAVLTECFEEGNWRVTMNGERVDYFRVNHAFMGVNIPAAGTYAFRFEYWPRVLTTALWLGATGLFFLLLTPLLARWFGSTQPEQ